MQIHEALKQNKKGIKKVTQSFSLESCLNYYIPCSDLVRFSARSLPSFPPGHSISLQGHRSAFDRHDNGLSSRDSIFRISSLASFGFALEPEARETFSKCLLKVERIPSLNKHLLTPSNLSKRQLSTAPHVLRLPPFSPVDLLERVRMSSFITKTMW